jgi:DNA-binding CsgD family transcriptional regulator
MPIATTLVGRHAELTQLGELLAADSERAMVVHGEPGIGKTALIEQVCADAAAQGWHVVRVLGVAAEEPFALGGLHQVVHNLDEFTPGLAARDRAALAPVFGGGQDSAISVLGLVAAVLNLLAAAAQTRPVLLVVDDVHWLDSVSAQVLGAVGRRLTAPRVAILAGRRVPNESVFSSEGWSELHLGPLAADDAEHLLQSAGVPLPAATRAALLTAAAGNPLALTELPRFADQIDLGTGAMPLTERLVAVFGDRLDRLDADVRADLLRAALDGIKVSMAVANRSRYVMHNVEPAIRAGLLVLNPLGQCAFRHPLVAAAVVHQATPAERRDAHRDLAALYCDVLARHAFHLAASQTRPDQQTADLLDRAAQMSVRMGGLPAAVEWLRQAAELSTDPKRRTALLAEAVFVAARAGRIDQARGLLGNAEADATESALAVLADCYQALHADGEVVATHRRLIDELTRADALDDQTVNRLVNLLLSVTNFADNPELRGRTNAALLPLQAWVHPAILMYRNVDEDIATTANDIRSLLKGYAELLPQLPMRWVFLVSFPAYCIDAMAEFRAPLQQAYAQLCEYGASIDALEGGRVVLLDLMSAGHWDQAQQVGAQCLEMAREIQGSELLRHQFLADLGVLAAWRGDLETARQYAAEVTAWSTPRGLHLLLSVAQRIAVRVALAEADHEAGYQAAIVLTTPGEFPRHWIQVGDDMLDLIEAAVHTGRMAQARAHTAEAVRLDLAQVSPRVAALTVAITAMTAPDSEADDLYRSALAHPGIAEFPFERARIGLAQGMWLRRRLRHIEARAALELAADGFDRLGARPWADRALAELRAAGAPIKRTGDPAELSTQERRVADHAAAGLTSKEIAGALNLSSRTVDSHLRNAFRKLGITRRAGIAAALQHQDRGTPADP